MIQYPVCGEHRAAFSLKANKVSAYRQIKEHRRFHAFSSLQDTRNKLPIVVDIDDTDCSSYCLSVFRRRLQTVNFVIRVRSSLLFILSSIEF